MAPSTVGGFRLAGNIGGRLYLNLSVLLGASAAIGLGRRVRGTVEQVFGRFPADLEVPPLPLPRRTIVVDLLRTGIPFALRVAGHRRNLPARVEAARTRCEVVRRRIRGTTTPDGLAALWHSDVEPLLRHTSRLLAAGARTNGAAVVRTRPWLVKRVGAADADALLTGAGAHGGHLESLGPVVGLARVARGDLGRDSYLRTWGHRCPDEFEVSAPRPVEDPDWIDRQLAAVPAGESDPLALLARQERVRDAARARFRARHPRREGSLRRRLARVAEATRAREAGRSEAVRAFLVLREFILRAGELTGLGEDLFFCTYEEILAVLADDTGVLDRVPARRTTYERLAALPPYPSLIRGEFDPFRWAADRRTGIHDATGDTLTGFPGVAGVVEGTARVLDRVEQRDRLDAGAILVTTAANVGWTPLFPRAFAVVTDVGAPLSHAAVVARELGIPAVVGCGDATTRIRSGDRIRVDGAAGTVEILDRDRGDEPGERR
nr:PEP-utilizing enzyme [Pseudonocardia sp. C8]